MCRRPISILPRTGRRSERVVSQLKIGDRVVAKPQQLGHQRRGTVKFASGIQYWVLFDGDEDITPSLSSWCLKPLTEEARTQALAA